MSKRVARAALITAVLAAGCGGGGDDGAPVAQTVTTPPEGGTITQTPVQPAATTTTHKREPRDEVKDLGTSTAETQRAPAEPEVTAPNSAGPFGPPEVKAPAQPKSAPDASRVRRTVRTYLRAIADSNGRRACAQMTPEGARRIAIKLGRNAPEVAGAPCSEAIVLYQGAYGKAIERPKVTAVRISGAEASAIGPLKQVARLQRVKKRWLITEYGQ